MHRACANERGKSQRRRWCAPNGWRRAGLASASVAIGVLFAGGIGSSAHAADWTTAASGAWSDALMWTPSDVPDSDTESAIISAAGSAYQVTLSGPLTIADLTLNSSDAMLALTDTLQAGTPAVAGKLTIASGTLTGNATLYGGPLEIGAGVSASSAASVTLISDAAANINKFAGAGGDVPAGMTVDIRPLQNSSNLSVNVHSTFVNHGTLELTPAVNNPVLTVAASTSFTNAGTLIAHANANGVGAVSIYGGGTFLNDTGATAQFHTSLFFTGDATNRGAIAVDANRYMQATNRFTQAGGSMDVGLSLFAPIFDFQGGSVTGPVDTNQLILAPTAGSATIRLKPYVSSHATIQGDIPANVSIVADGASNLTGVALTGGTLVNGGELHVQQTADKHVFLSTNGMAGNGLLSNDGHLRVTGGQVLNLTGGFAQSASGTLSLTLAGADFDRLHISGAATLGGNMEISLDPAFDPISTPPAQQSFQVLTFASHIGEFDALLGRYVRQGYFWDPTYSATDLTLTLTQAQPGDADVDGDVDLSDLGALATHYGATSGQDWLQGDFDGDGDVDLADLGTLASHYGAGSAQALADFQALASVPEPSCAAFALLVLPLLRRRRDRL